LALAATAREHERHGARPTIGSRNLAIVVTAMFDAWAAYDARAVGTRLGGRLRRPAVERTLANKEKALAYAVTRVLLDLYAEDDKWIADVVRNRSAGSTPGGPPGNSMARSWPLPPVGKLCSSAAVNPAVCGTLQQVSRSQEFRVTASDNSSRSLSELTKPPKEASLSEQELDHRWADLISDDSQEAFRAVGALVRARGQAVTFLKQRLQPAEVSVAPNLEQLIADSDSNEFKVREKATKDLTNLGPVAEKALVRALAGNLSLEARRRAAGILQGLKESKGSPAPTGEPLRTLRALEVLEQVATPDAEMLLGRLSKGAADSPLTEQAQIALEHLKSLRAKR
jgi:hypothetical protein